MHMFHIFVQHIVSALVSRTSYLANMCEWRDFDQLGSTIFSKWAYSFSMHVNIEHKQTSMPTSHVQSDNIPPLDFSEPH